MNNGYIRNINYFNYRFDIYSLARAISTKISDKNVGIILENRYEFLVTFFANIILKNTITDYIITIISPSIRDSCADLNCTGYTKITIMNN